MEVDSKPFPSCQVQRGNRPRSSASQARSGFDEERWEMHERRRVPTDFFFSRSSNHDLANQ